MPPIPEQPYTMSDMPNKIAKRYYYKGNLLDSVTTTYEYSNPAFNDTDVCYYNKYGVRQSNISI